MDTSLTTDNNITPTVPSTGETTVDTIRTELSKLDPTLGSAVTEKFVLAALGSVAHSCADSRPPER